MSNCYVIIECESKTILVKRNGRWEVRFGFSQQESGYYRCAMFSCISKPSYENVCSIVENYNKENGTSYHISQEEYDNNEANM